MKTIFLIKGMHCAVCQANIQKKVGKLAGIVKADVNLATSRMIVEYHEEIVSCHDIIHAVESAGFGAERLKEETQERSLPEDKGRLTELILSILFLIPLALLAFRELLAMPVPQWITEHPVCTSWLQLLFLLPILYFNRRFFIQGTRTLLKGAPNMDTLVAIGSGAGTLYSLLILCHLLPGNVKDMYFDASGMILVLVGIGKYLEAGTKKHASDAIAKLIRLAPENAAVEKNGKEISISVKDLKQGDIILLRPGDSIPVDGTVTEGSSSVDQSAVTGESVPVRKQRGDKVISGTLNTSGFLKFRAEAVGKDTTLARIIALVSEAGATKAPIARIADKVSLVFVPVVLGLAVLTLTVWLICGAGFSFALSNCITVVLISCPCALGLATPLAVMAGIGRGAGQGIIFRSGEALEILSKVDSVVFDKTGTLTHGKPSVSRIYPAENVTEERLIRIAASMEKQSQHPFAKAIVHCAEEHKTALLEAVDFQLIPGLGISAVIDNALCAGGNARFMKQYGFEAVPANISNGDSLIYFACGKEFLGAVSLSDAVKPDAKDAVGQLHENNISVMMLTGDNQRTAQSVAEQLGIEQTEAEILPEDKEKVIRKYQEQGKTVAMVGDGINDAPALTRADVGIAMGSGTDIALDSADVILMNSEVINVPAAVALSKKVVRNIRINLFWAFFYNVLAIPVAAGVFYPLFHISLSPVWGAAAMSASSLCVAVNALRLRYACSTRTT